MESFKMDTPWHIVIEAHNDLHRAIVAASGNPRLLDTYDRYRDDLQFMLSYLGEVHSVDTFVQHHLELVNQIRLNGIEALELLEFDLSQFGVPPLLEALSGLEETTYSRYPS
jgi:DNA-binding GntR family transcriptional regulator